MFAQYISEHLATKGMEPLHALYKDAEFGEFFRAKVEDAGFLNSIRQDSFHRHTMSIIFLYEYSLRGPDFTMPTNPDELHAQKLVKLWNLAAAIDQRSVPEAVATLSYMFSGIFNPIGLASARLEQYASALYEKTILFHAIPGFGQAGISNDKFANSTIFEGLDIDTYQSPSWKLYRVWQARINDTSPQGFWSNAIHGAVAGSG